jgi:hypothetical protein
VFLEKFQIMEKQIPILRSVDGFVLDYVDAAAVLLNQGNYVPIFNRKGFLVKAYRRDRVALVPLSNCGDHFRQTLAKGRTFHTLKGTSGSEY